MTAEPAANPEPARPSAEGTLGRTPFAHVLLYAHARGLTGVVELEPEGAGVLAQVLLVDGRLAKVLGEGLSPRLGEVLVETTSLTADQIDDAYAFRESRSLGRALLEEGLVTEDELRVALALQVERKLTSLFELGDETRFAYYHGDERVAGVGGDELSSLDPFPVIWKGVKQAPPWEHVHGTLARIGGYGLRLVAQAEPARFGFDADEAAVAAALEGAAVRIHDVLRLGLLPASATQLVLYALVATKQVEVVELSPSARALASSPPPPAASGQQPLARVALQPRVVPQGPAPAVEGRAPSSARDPRAPTPMPEQSGLTATPMDDPGPGGDLSDDPARRRLQVVSRASAAVDEDLYAVLGVAPTSTPAEVEAAFLDRMKRWHPDRLPSALADVRAVATRLVARLTEARATLVDPARRRAYDDVLAGGTSTQDEEAQVERVLRAASDFQKAQVHLKRNDLAACEEAVRAAWEGDPTQADYLALLTWVESQKPEAQAPDALAKLIAKLDKAVSLGERCERAYFYRGMLLKRAGQLPRAMADFRRSAELDPRNLDAVREVRLYTMRGGAPSVPPPKPSTSKSPPPPAGGGGLLGRLFKR